MKTLNCKIISAVFLITQLGTIQVVQADETEGAVGETIINEVDNAFAVAISNRASMTVEIIDRVRAEAEEKGFVGWEDELTSKLNEISDEAFLAAYNAGDDYKTVAAAMAGVSFDKTALVNNLNTSTPAAKGVVAAKLGDADKDFVYTPIPPCRIVSTTAVGGKIPGGTSRGYYAHGTSVGLDGQVVNPAGCPIPSFDAYGGYVLNITAYQPEGNGHLRVYAEGDPLPTASILNYKAGETVANSTIVKGGYNLGYDFRIYTPTTTHVIIDVMGYFDKPERTMPDTYTVKSATSTINANTNLTLTTPSCPTGYRLTSGGYDTNSWDVRIVESRGGTIVGANVIGNTWRCSARNTGAISATLACIGYCLRIPGRQSEDR